jgi:hypothetical protein
METGTGRAKHIEDISKGLFRQTDFLFLARGIHFPIAWKAHSSSRSFPTFTPKAIRR